jgi:two-component system, OmpR family, response regulator MtrA
MTTIVNELGIGGLPLLVCVSPDPGVRERVARQLDGGGIVLMCPDVNALRALLTTVGPAPTAPLSDPGSAATPSPVPDLVIDVDDHQVRWRGAALPLTRLEVELIAQLATPPVRVWPYDRLFAAVWDAAYLGDNSILHSAVKRLRRKLREVGDDLSIDTVRGIGYRLVTA